MILATLGLFLVGCFPGDSEEPSVTPTEAPAPVASDTTTSTEPEASMNAEPAQEMTQPTATPQSVPGAPNPEPVPTAPVIQAPSGGENQVFNVGGTRPANSGNGMATDGGKLTLLFADPPTFDPHLAEDNISGLLVNEIFGGLVNIEPFNFAVAPDLAESWEISEDGTTYTFRIHPNAKFHDGSPVTSQDVKWSIDRVTDPELASPVAHQYLDDIVGVEARLDGASPEVSGVQVVDENTVRFTIDAAKAYFLAKLTYPSGFVLDADNVALGDSWFETPNGTGPFRLDEYQIGEIIRLGRNEYYHLGPPHIDEVEMILSGGSSMILFENDEIDITGVGLADLERILDPTSPLNPLVHPYPARFTTSYIGLNVDQAPLEDPKFRKALNLAFDRDQIASVVYEGAVRPAKTIIPPRFPSFNPNLDPYPYDPEEARRLLAESTYGADPDSIPRLILSISGSLGAAVPLGLEVILQAWEQELGLQVEIQQTEWATFLQDVNDERYQMFSLAWGADYPDPENFLDLLFHSESEGNRTNYSNPEVDAILEEARVEQDPARRFELYNQVEEMILDDAPWVLLWNDEDWYFLIKPHVNDYFLLPMTIPKFRYIHFTQQ